MKRELCMVSVIVILVSLLSIPVFAIDSEERAPMGPSIASPLPPQSSAPNVFGLQYNILQIPASSFVPRDAAYSLNYHSAGYMSPTTPIRLWAPVTLPAGVNITYLDLYFYDTNATYDITAWLTGYSGGDFWGTAPVATDFATVSSVGSDGYGYSYSSSFNHTVNNNVAYNFGYQYAVVVYFPVADGSLRFKGVDIWWHRQISPAPSTARFTDVPTTHWAFRFIEALADSGITTGCAAGLYCPNNNVTRAEMAAFLARALGLHWPY